MVTKVLEFLKTISFVRPEYFTAFLIPTCLFVLWLLIFFWKLNTRPPKTSGSHYPWIGKKKIWLFMLAISALAIFASARPYSKHSVVVRSGSVDVIVVLDKSISMRISDLKPSRLETAKRKIKDLINGNILREGDRIALFAFDRSSYRKLYLTSDFDRFLLSLDRIVFPEKLSGDESIWSTDFSVALERIYESLDSQDSFDLNYKRSLRKNKAPRIIFFFSDGNDETEDTVRVDKALEEFRDRKIKIYSVGVGTRTGAPLIDALRDYKLGMDYDIYTEEDMRGINSSVQIRLLERLAWRTGGKPYILDKESQNLANFFQNAIDPLRMSALVQEKEVDESQELWGFVLEFGLLILILSIIFY